MFKPPVTAPILSAAIACASSSTAEGEAFSNSAANEAQAGTGSAATAAAQGEDAAKKSSEDTAAELADMFSAFGDGISFEEV